MKKIVFLAGLIFFFGVFAEDCSYLKNVSGFVPESNPGQFNYYYNIDLCEENTPIHDEIGKYIQGIKKTTNKRPVELIRDVGNVLCRGYYGTCDENSFYGRFLMSCEKARSKAATQTTNKIVSLTTEFYLDSFAQCSTLADSYMMAYKSSAFEEIAESHKKIIETSNQQYFEKSYEKKNALLGTIQTFMTMVSNVSRSFQGYATEVFK